MAVTREQVIEYLSALSPDRLQDLILELEEIWGIERPASWWTSTMGVAMGEVSMGVPTWEVVLLDVGDRRVAVMKALRSMLDLSLVAARDLSTRSRPSSRRTALTTKPSICFGC